MIGFVSTFGCSFSSCLDCQFVGSYSAVFLTSLHSTHFAGDIDSTAGVDSTLIGSVVFDSSFTSGFLGFSFFFGLLSLTCLMTNSAGLISIAGFSKTFSFFSLIGSSFILDFDSLTSSYFDFFFSLTSFTGSSFFVGFFFG